MMKSLRCAALLGTIVVCCVSCDQATKSIAMAQLAGRPPISLLGDTVRLSYAENPGGFLSLGADLPGWIRSWAFGLLALFAVLALLIVAIPDHSLDRLQVVAVSLLIAGGVGNITDRVIYGVVRDFLNVGVGPFRTGVFNVADLAITAAGVLLVKGLWKERER
jgi:signal peptidase II